MSRAAAGEPLYVFAAGGLRFAIALEALWRVQRIEEVTRMPRAPEHVAGVALLQNEVVACLDLGRLAGRGPLPPGPCIAAIVQGTDLRAALVSREVGTTEMLDPARLGPPSPALVGRFGPALRGQAALEGGSAAVLDVSALLASLIPRRAEVHGHAG